MSLWQGGQIMKNVVELRARVALCRQLAVREPTNRGIWLAEAKKWSHLAEDSRFETPACRSADDEPNFASALMDEFSPTLLVM
jgi:hypothetical protein